MCLHNFMPEDFPSTVIPHLRECWDSWRQSVWKIKVSLSPSSDASWWRTDQAKKALGNAENVFQRRFFGF
jgi:hypothetical protein